MTFLRLAFGMGGGSAGSVPVAELHAATAGFLAEGTVGLDWPADAIADTDSVASLPGNAAKLLLAMVMLAVGAMPRGGRMSVHIARLEDGIGLAVNAAGPGVALKSDLSVALAAEAMPDMLTARSVHAYMAGRLAAAAGGRLEAETTDGEIRFAALVSDRTQYPKAVP